MSTFKEVDAEGNKKSYQGSRDGKEIQYRLVYLLSYKKYLEQIKKLEPMVRSN